MEEDFFETDEDWRQDEVVDVAVLFRVIMAPVKKAINVVFLSYAILGEEIEPSGRTKSE